jgi:glyoxylase-like metal-dependent hydrolase (beta-lactamase superfamily II)
MLPQRLVLSFPFLFLLGFGLASARSQGEVTIETVPVRGAVSMLVGRGGNIGVSAGADGVLVVDSQFQDLAPKLEAALAKLKPGAPRFLVNTHHHGDHTGGNGVLAKGAVILAHENVRARLGEEKKEPAALPMVTYAASVNVHWNGEEVRLLHVPGAHTDGDTVVWFTGSNVIHLGDLYFELGYPYVDVASGGNVLGLIEGLEKLAAELPDDIRILPGHGKVTGKKELLDYLAMLNTITERVRSGLAAKKDAATLVKDGITKDFDDRWGHFDFVPPAKFVESVVASLR